MYIHFQKKKKSQYKNDVGDGLLETILISSLLFLCLPYCWSGTVFQLALVTLWSLKQNHSPVVKSLM